MKKSNVLIAVVILSLFFVSCKKDDAPTPETPEPAAGVYVLNQGTFNANNTTLTYYDFGTKSAMTDFYKNVNGNGLGDTGNDMLIYGSKLYVVMNVSSYVEVAEAATAKGIKKIEMKNNNEQPLTPRYIVGYKNHVFVSCWDGTVQVIDTASLEITKTIKVGANPEKMAIDGNKLYVANSGGITPGYDSTVSVIDLATFEETSKIKVGTNPTVIASDGQGTLFVGTMGNYGDIQPTLVKINTANNSVTGVSKTQVSALRYYKNNLYAIAGDFAAQKVVVIRTSDLSADNDFVSDGTAVAIPYGLDIDENTGDMYVTDAVDYMTSPAGVVYCFDVAGKKKFSFSVAPGINPCKVVFVGK